MNPNLTMGDVDVDGAVSDAAARLGGDTRAAFLRKGAIAGAAAGLLALSATSADAATMGDIDILNYALTLEYLEAAFYKEALAKGALSGATKKYATVVAADEAAHVKALKGALGSKAVKTPKFNFQGTTANQATFQKTAMVLEDTGVAAYKGQAPLIKATPILEAALSIHTVEARHASWIRDILGVSPAPVSFDQPLTMAQVLSAVGKTGFIVDPSTTGTMAPQFNG
jgi:rubrerythrin